MSRAETLTPEELKRLKELEELKPLDFDAPESAVARSDAQRMMDYEDALLEPHDAEFYLDLHGDTLRPGPYAKDSIPGHRGRPTNAEQQRINELMERNGCHTCGTKNPGTTSGDAIADHYPAEALGDPTEFLPHCVDCARRQGGQVLQELRRRRLR